MPVASPVARPLVSRAFGFHAARETVPLPGIPVDALRLDRGYMGDQTKVEYRLGGRDGTFRVLRATHDPDRMGCDDRARDLYENRKVPLAPGFEVVSISWSHDPLRNLETSAIHQTDLGRYDFRWDDGNTAVFTSGVQRTYAKKTSFSFNPIVEWLPMMGEHYLQVRPGGAVCTSRYVAIIHASGPRGMKPVP